MSPKEHTDKVAAEAIKKKSESPFRCDNCGKTFVSESEQREHEKSQHSQPADKRAG